MQRRFGDKCGGTQNPFCATGLDDFWFHTLSPPLGLLGGPPVSTRTGHQRPIAQGNFLRLAEVAASGRATLFTAPFVVPLSRPWSDKRDFVDLNYLFELRTPPWLPLRLGVNKGDCCCCCCRSSLQDRLCTKSWTRSTGRRSVVSNHKLTQLRTPRAEALLSFLDRM